MKRPTRATTKPEGLAKQRALIRALIEQHGWGGSPATPDPAVDLRKSAESNIIPFPTVRR